MGFGGAPPPRELGSREPKKETVKISTKKRTPEGHGGGATTDLQNEPEPDG